MRLVKVPSLTRQLLAFSRRQVVQPRTIDINDIIRRVDSLLRRVIGEDIELHIELAHPLPAVTVDPGQLEQVLMNLAVNARDAMPQGGRVVIATTIVSFQPEDVADLRGCDARTSRRAHRQRYGHRHGRRRAEACVRAIFTTKEQGRGTGLGLATVHGIVQQWQGTIDVTDQVGHGSRSSASGDPGIPAHRGRRAPMPRNRTEQSTLLVEDQPQARDVICETLRRRGYTVIQAADGAEGNRESRTASRRHRPAADRRRDAGNQRPPAGRTHSIGGSIRAGDLYVRVHGRRDHSARCP